MLTQLSLVTVLAFIFIPANLASSIFGMNVQQINKTGHSITFFILTSVALLIMSGLGFYFRHTLRRVTSWTLAQSEKLVVWVVSTKLVSKWIPSGVVGLLVAPLVACGLLIAGVFVGLLYAVKFSTLWIYWFARTLNIKATNRRVRMHF